ncbi:MAG: PepSY domain-containing protein, partial [Burkholderiales bacterium]
PLSLTQAIAVAERLHVGSRTAAVTFEISDRPGYRVRTVRNKQVWENVVDVITGRAIGLEASFSMSDLEVDERDNIMALTSVGQELSEAVAIAEKAAAGKAISGGLVKEEDQVNFVVVVLSDDRVKEVFLEPPRAASKARPAVSRRN